MNRRTIATITASIGEGGISVIHVSGPSSIEIVNKIFKGKGIKDLSQAEDGKLYYGNIMETCSEPFASLRTGSRESNGVPIDEVIINVSKKDGSLVQKSTQESGSMSDNLLVGVDEAASLFGGFTGQDLVEINCHGGILATRKALNCIKAAGAIEVDWQELATESLRNNKIDSIQREALLEIPKAKTTLAAKVFLDQYKGALSAELFKCGIRNVETHKAMSDEQRAMSHSALGPHCSVLIARPAIRNPQSAIVQLLQTADFGIALSVPLKVTIAGSPNAGKSTLVNALLGKERVIVHHEPGTTRDAVTDIISVNGMPFELTDTAGIRNTNDVIEGLAIEETVRRLSTTDIAMIIFDNSRPLTEDGVKIINALETLKCKSLVEIIPVVNKIDLSSKLNITGLQSHFSQPICPISALNGNGLSELSSQLVARFADYIEYVPGRPIIFTERQKGLLLEAAHLFESESRDSRLKTWDEGISDKNEFDLCSI